MRSLLAALYVTCVRELTPRSPTVSHNLGSETKKATGIPMYMAIGQCGSVLGSHLYPATEGPHYMYVPSPLITSPCSR